MHTTHASTQCSVRQQSVHTKWVWLYRFVEYKNTLEKYFYTTITSVTIYLCYSQLVISFKRVFWKKKKKKLWVFFGGQLFYAKKKHVFYKKNTNVFFRIASLVPHPKGRANHHTTTMPPESGAQIRRIFGTQPQAPGRLAGTSAAPQWGRRAKSRAR